MFRAVNTLLLLAVSFTVANAAHMKQSGDNGQVKQVVALLRDITQKLASEREKENIVYNEVRKYCEGNSEKLQASSESVIAEDSKNTDSDDHASTAVDSNINASPISASPEDSEAASSTTEDTDSDASPGKPEPQPDAIKVTASNTDGEDQYSIDIEQMNALLNDAEGEETGDSHHGSSGKSSEHIAIKTHSIDSRRNEASVKRVSPQQVKHVKQVVQDQSVAKASQGLAKQLRPAAKSSSKDQYQQVSSQSREEDSATVDQLANIVKAAIEPEIQIAKSIERSASESAPGAEQERKGESAVAGYQPLANAVLSIDDTAVEETGGFVPPPEAVPAQTPVKVVLKAVPERPQKKLADVDPQIKAAESEIDETANVVASFEKDLEPAPAPQDNEVLDMALQTKPVLPNVVKKVVSQAEQQEKDAISVAAMSSAFNDLGGAIPNIDQQAMQFYSGFGGEPASLDTLGGLSAGASFLQVAEKRMHRLKSSPVMHADLDAAWSALKEITEDTKSAYASLKELSSMEQLDNTESTDSLDGASSGSQEISDQCVLLMEEFDRREKARVVRETELEARSKRLLRNMHSSHEHKTKHLRSQN